MLMLAISAEEAVKDYAVILSLARNWEQLPTRKPGAIAQLAERLDRTQEVGGSNPPSSIQSAPHMRGLAPIDPDSARFGRRPELRRPYRHRNGDAPTERASAKSKTAGAKIANKDGGKRLRPGALDGLVLGYMKRNRGKLPVTVPRVVS
jgi:hypothetical protein